MTSSSTREYTDAARRAELDRTGRCGLRRPRRILWTQCAAHGGGYYFYDVRIERLTNKADTRNWAEEPDMRKVRGLCMLCGSAEVFFVGIDELDEHRYSPLELCLCGLPANHLLPTSEFRQQYNAVATPCRPSSNGQANVS